MSFKPATGWGFVTAAGALLLASIGPTTGAVMGWIERERRRGLAELKDGATIAPVIVLADPDRAAAQDHAAAQAKAMARR